MKNYLSKFDKDKVSMREMQKIENAITVWYNVTDVIRDLAKDGAPSVMEYVDKVEMMICSLYDWEEDWKQDTLSYIEKKYDEMRKVKEIDLFACYKDGKAAKICNDARLIRITFSNGSAIEVSNSEWGSVILEPGEK